MDDNDRIIRDDPPDASSMNLRNGSLSLVTNAGEANLPKHDPRDKNAFTYLEILMATHNFSKDNFLGKGGSGSVYRCYLARLGQVVAVKQLNYDSNHASLQRTAEFDSEVMRLSSTDHTNIVKLYGYCAEGKVGHDRKALDWNTRIRIAAGVAQGLVYIHKTMEPPVIHSDVKSSNILLGEDYHPKLSDFGFSLVRPTSSDSHFTKRVMGTLGNCAPEYAMTDKSDAYSFGVVLLEILTGRKAHDPSKPYNEQNLVEWAKSEFRTNNINLARMADPLLRGQFPEIGFERAMWLAGLCVVEDPGKRREISKIEPYISFLASQPYHPKPLPAIMETGEHRGRQRSQAEYVLGIGTLILQCLYCISVLYRFFCCFSH